MTVELTYQNLITLSALIAAIIALVSHFAKGVRWFDRQESYAEEINSIKAEQEILVNGMLACLKGLAEQGCNGPVHDAINQIESHLNSKSHEVQFLHQKSSE